MDTIIVTVTDRGGSFRCDMELPTGKPMVALKIEMAAALNAYDPRLSLDGQKMRLLNTRTDHRIPDPATLEMAGVWNGDYLVIETA